MSSSGIEKVTRKLRWMDPTSVDRSASALRSFGLDIITLATSKSLHFALSKAIQRNPLKLSQSSSVEKALRTKILMAVNLLITIKELSARHLWNKRKSRNVSFPLSMMDLDNSISNPDAHFALFTFALGKHENLQTFRQVLIFRCARFSDKEVFKLWSWDIFFFRATRAPRIIKPSILWL